MKSIEVSLMKASLKNTRYLLIALVVLQIPLIQNAVKYPLYGLKIDVSREAQEGLYFEPAINFIEKDSEYYDNITLFDITKSSIIGDFEEVEAYRNESGLEISGVGPFTFVSYITVIPADPIYLYVECTSENLENITTQIEVKISTYYDNMKIYEFKLTPKINTTVGIHKTIDYEHYASIKKFKIKLSATIRPYFTDYFHININSLKIIEKSSASFFKIRARCSDAYNESILNAISELHKSVYYYLGIWGKVNIMDKESGEKIYTIYSHKEQEEYIVTYLSNNSKYFYKFNLNMGIWSITYRFSFIIDPSKNSSLEIVARFPIFRLHLSIFSPAAEMLSKFWAEILEIGDENLPFLELQLSKNLEAIPIPPGIYELKIFDPTTGGTLYKFSFKLRNSSIAININIFVYNFCNTPVSLPVLGLYISYISCLVCLLATFFVPYIISKRKKKIS